MSDKITPSAKVSKAYATTVGLEIHAELKTKSKMFCGCKNDPHDSQPNSHVCPVCMAHPGTLPVVNKEAVRSLLHVGTAVDGELASYTEFDRKNYFYPDIPKAYQISQYQFPFVKGGEVAGVALTRIHLEEDTARSLHDKGEGSIVDFNRAGVPLMELVTEPVIHSGTQASQFAKELQLLLRTLGVSDANMEKGEMRVEANISVSQNDALGTKVEVKNLNSFKSVELAIEYETQRQIELLENGKVVDQETRGWDENKGKTFAQRKKETAHDYRYFPDPDIPKIQRELVEDFSDTRLSEILPKMPIIIRERYRNLGLQLDQVELLLSEPSYTRFFDTLIATLPDTVSPRLAANYVLSDVVSLLRPDMTLDSTYPDKFASLLELLATDKITSRVVKDLILEVLFDGKDALLLAEERKLLQITDDNELVKLVEQIISDNQSVVEEFKTGKEASLQYLIGQGMKETRGSANPKKLAELFRKHIS